MDDGNRRFTDREVALVLRRATEIEDVEPTPGHGGTSLADLRAIAKEVGISERAIEQAVSSLDSRLAEPARLLGPRGIRKAVGAVPGVLDEDEVGRLIRVVDREAPYAGTVTEALGAVRWMGGNRFGTMQVSISPGGRETAVEVVEKAESVHRYVFQLLPAAWGAILSMGPVAAMGAPGLLVTAGATLAGWGLGRAFWGYMDRRGQRRVRRLAEALGDEGRKLGEAT